MRPSISIVVPCFNQGRFLSQAVESALAQTHAAIEIVVVNDGSTDDTSEVVARYPRVRYLRQQNHGLAEARNTGLRASSGEFVVFLDADDRLLPTAVSIGVSQLATRPECAFVSGEHRYIGTDGATVAEWTRTMPSDHHYTALLRGNYIGMIATVLFRRRVFDEVSPFNPKWRACEDYDLYLRIARRFPVCAHTTVVAEYRRHGSAMSNDPVRMLGAAVSVLRNQRRVIASATEEKALLEGLRYWRDYYGEAVVARVHRDWRRSGYRRNACLGVLELARHSPGTLANLVKTFTRVQD